MIILFNYSLFFHFHLLVAHQKKVPKPKPGKPQANRKKKAINVSAVSNDLDKLEALIGNDITKEVKAHITWMKNRYNRVNPIIID